MCTRILWSDNGVATVVARTMDWPDSTYPIITVLPRGMKREGNKVGPIDIVGENPCMWVSKFGSIVTTIYGVGTADGFNEKGLGVHLLFLQDTSFGERDVTKPGLQAALWPQYVLDNAADVKEALEILEGVQIIIAESHGHYATVHLSMEDVSGDSAIIEYQNGKRKIFHGRDFKVQTNEPPYQEQLDLLAEKDFSNPSDTTPLDGNINPIARFQRSVYFLNLLPEPKNLRETVAGVLSIARNVSIPFGAPYESFGTYNTEYRTVCDLTNKRYYFELSTCPNVIWTDLLEFDLAKGGQVKILDPDNIDISGNATDKFINADPPF
jgi:choloylglycine hydrolase